MSRALSFELDENLDTAQSTNFGGGLTAPFTAHPHEDPKTGEWHAITYESKPKIKSGMLLLIARGRSSPTRHPSSRRTFNTRVCLTDDYVVVFDLPVTISLGALAQGYNFPYRWNENHKARIGLLPRAGDVAEIIWCDVDRYVFHVAG